MSNSDSKLVDLASYFRRDPKEPDTDRTPSAEESLRLIRAFLGVADRARRQEIIALAEQASAAQNR